MQTFLSIVLPVPIFPSDRTDRMALIVPPWETRWIVLQSLRAAYRFNTRKKPVRQDVEGLHAGVGIVAQESLLILQRHARQRTRNPAR